ncbi:MAG: MCE family protein, partial [Ignavibacteriales bacterium]|nr:MCE family protein [Ignavibacteriales bacterium]
MKLKMKYTERFVSVFLVAAFLLLISAITFIVISKKFFEKKIVYKAKLADANGLGPSTPIYFKGFKIGTIKEFHLTEQNYIEATLEIFTEYKEKIVYNSALWKGLNPVTNASSLEFLQGLDNNVPLPEGSIIPAIDVPEGQRLLLLKKVKQSGDPLSTLLANLQTFTEGLTADTLQNKGAIFKALNNFITVSEDVKEISERLNYITGALIDENIPNKGPLFKILNNTADLTGELKKTDQMIKQTILRADSLLTAYQNPDSLGLRLIDPTGEKLINPIRQTIAGFNTLLPKFEYFMGYMNNRTGDITVILEDLKTTLRQAQTTFDAINKLTTGTGDLLQGNQVNPAYSRQKYEEK